ncbi:MAG: hypothetical protein HW387_1607 [Parachlamydiales bacterium]|nr:hypothetical protein [Parachlamydiales bacterium]
MSQLLIHLHNILKNSSLKGGDSSVAFGCGAANAAYRTNKISCLDPLLKGWDCGKECVQSYHIACL